MKHVEWDCPLDHTHEHYGKFQSCFDEWFYGRFCMESGTADEEGGDQSDGPGYFQLFLLNDADHDPSMFDDGVAVPKEYKAVIVEHTNSGAIYVNVYDSHNDAHAAWADYALMIQQWDGEYPYEDDGIIFHDWRSGWHVQLDGKLYENDIGTREQAVIALAKAMEEQGYFSNCYEEGERGGYTNISDEVASINTTVGTTSG